MKVAVAGTGNVAKYLFEELVKHGHEVVVLTRSRKNNLALEQRKTDYSITSLTSALDDCDALVSTVADYTNHALTTKVHLDMLEACKQSTKCKTFIPAEWTGDVQRVPDQPSFLAEHNKELHGRLKQETEIRWTIICNSWFTEYVLPAAQRHLPDIGPIWAMDHPSMVFTIYGPGTQLIDLTSVRDVAKATAVMLDSKEPWEPYTYMSGQQLSWNELFAIMKRRSQAWQSRHKSLGETAQQIVANESPESTLIAEFEIQSYSGVLTLPKEEVERHRQQYFPGVHFRNVDHILDAGANRPGDIA